MKAIRPSISRLTRRSPLRADLGRGCGIAIVALSREPSGNGVNLLFLSGHVSAQSVTERPQRKSRTDGKQFGPPASAHHDCPTPSIEIHPSQDVRESTSRHSPLLTHRRLNSDDRIYPLMAKRGAALKYYSMQLAIMRRILFITVSPRVFTREGLRFGSGLSTSPANRVKVRGDFDACRCRVEWMPDGLKQPVCVMHEIVLHVARWQPSQVHQSGNLRQVLGGIMTDVTMAGAFRLANVFSKTAAIYSRRFVPFIILTFIASIPNYVALFAIGVPDVDTDPSAFAEARVGLGLLDFLTKSLASGAVMYGVVQELRGRPFSVGDSIQIAFRRFLPMLGVAICTTIVIVLGMLLLVVPGIIAACIYYVAMPACIAERAGVFASMSRSRFLTRGHRWQVFGTFVLIFVASIVLVLILGAIFALTGQAGVLISTQALGLIIGSFNGVLVSVFYYELRVAKEGVDIDKIASIFE
jgi:hypothetical protein